MDNPQKELHDALATVEKERRDLLEAESSVRAASTVEHNVRIRLEKAQKKLDELMAKFRHENAGSNQDWRQSA